MANQPPVPTPWPAARASPTPPPQPATQPQSPSPPQSKPPSPSRSPSATSTKIPIRRIRARPPSPSPSQKSSQKQPTEQISLQQPSPSSRRYSEPSPIPTRSRSPSPPQEASEPQQEAATQEVSLAPSLSAPSVLQPDSPAKKPVEPQPQESQPTVEALSQTTAQPQPEPSTRPKAQEQSPSQPAPQRTEAGNQLTENLEPKTVSVDTVLSTTRSHNHISEREPKEIKGENSKTNRESKQEPPLAEEDGKPEKNMEPRSLESETASEGNKNDEPKAKPEVQLAKKSTLSGDESKNRMEIMSSIAEPDSQTPRLHPATREIITQPRSSGQQANLNGSKGREKTMGPRPRSIPLAPPSPGERASFHKEIKEGISKLVQKLKLGQLQQLGSEGTIRSITLTGENKGATMFIGHETANMEGVLYTHRRHGLNNNKAEASIDNKEIQKQLLNHTRNKNPARTASMNSNVQSINNSLLHESSCSGRDPGIHLVLSIKPRKPLKLKKNDVSIETLRNAVSSSETRRSVKHQEAS